MECKELTRMVAFWKAASGYEARRPASEDQVVLHDPLGAGPNFAPNTYGSCCGSFPWVRPRPT
jgi:hypothetical protein